MRNGDVVMVVGWVGVRAGVKRLRSHLWHFQVKCARASFGAAHGASHARPRARKHTPEAGGAAGLWPPTRPHPRFLRLRVCATTCVKLFPFNFPSFFFSMRDENIDVCLRTLYIYVGNMCELCDEAFALAFIEKKPTVEAACCGSTLTLSLSLSLFPCLSLSPPPLAADPATTAVDEKKKIPLSIAANGRIIWKARRVKVNVLLFLCQSLLLFFS